MNNSGLVFGFIDTKRHACWARDQSALEKAQEHQSVQALSITPA